MPMERRMFLHALLQLLFFLFDMIATFRLWADKNPIERP